MRVSSPTLSVHVPEWVNDLASFRRWLETPDFPERGWLSHLNGELWLDLNMETLEHNTVKTCVVSSLYPLVASEGLGRLQSDRMRLTYPEVGLSTEPDALFLSAKSLQRQRVQFAKGGKSLEVIGSPDMVLEVVSDSSEEKDTVILLDLYFKAGVEEYWLIDPREGLSFDLYRRGRSGFTPARRREGWLRSHVFRRSFRLSQQESDLDLPAYLLEIRK